MPAASSSRDSDDDLDDLDLEGTMPGEEMGAG
jgi:hypothetical protein